MDVRPNVADGGDDTVIGKPQITEEKCDALVAEALAALNVAEPPLLVVGLRGYYANSFGKAGANDFNCFDDGIIVREGGDIIGRFNGNTDPSEKEGRAQLKPGRIYTFYKGKHKGRIDAFRAHPEGVRWDCWRMKNGVLVDSTCAAINFHDAGESSTWSEGCQTVPGASNKTYGNQFAAFRTLVYGLMDKHKLKVMSYLLLDVAGKM